MPIPASEFIMGLPDAGSHFHADLQPFPPEYPPHRVRITKPFLIGVTEVTQAEYVAVMRSNPSWLAGRQGRTDRFGDTPLREVDREALDTGSYPVEDVTWHDAKLFCSRMSQLPSELSAGRKYRLPTEAEWEFACRSGSSEPYQYSDKIPPPECLVAPPTPAPVPDLWFVLCGTQSESGIQGFVDNDSLRKRHVVIPVGKYYEGTAKYLTLVCDHDVDNANGECQISQLRIYELGDDDSRTLNWNDRKIESYGLAAEQDGSGTFSVEDNGNSVRLQGNVWKATPLEYRITSSTVLEFDFESIRRADVVAIGFDTDLTATAIVDSTADENDGRTGLVIVDERLREQRNLYLRYAQSLREYYERPQPHSDGGDTVGQGRSLPIVPVGSFEPNSWGLYDMRGNVFEWCDDWHEAGYYAGSPANDPTGPVSGFHKVVRGSDWLLVGDFCAQNRYNTSPQQSSRFIGFRVVCEPSELNGVFE